MALMVSLTITLAGSNGWLGGGLPPNGGLNGNGTQVVHYTTTYGDPVFGQVSCTGVHQTGKNFPIPGQDSFTCTAQPAGTPLSNVVPNQTLTLGNGIPGWLSDFYGMQGGFYYATAFNGVVSSDGTSYTAVVKYY